MSPIEVRFYRAPTLPLTCATRASRPRFFLTGVVTWVVTAAVRRARPAPRRPECAVHFTLLSGRG